MKIKHSVLRTRTSQPRFKSKYNYTPILTYCVLPYYSYVKSVQTQVMIGNAKGGVRGEEERKFQAAKDKKEKAKNDALLASLFKGA